MKAPIASNVGNAATVVGLAREGTALARFLATHGWRVTATDLKQAEELRGPLQQLSGLDVRYCLGGHPPEVLDCDVLFVSPGVPLDAPVIAEARRRGLRLSCESRLFCHLCPAKVVGVTGSSGKTTTATLIARMLESSGRQVHLGGNIGRPLIGELQRIGAGDAVVMELSSFQLDFFGPVLDAPPQAEGSSPLFPDGGWSPGLATVLNVTPNHLDRHASMAAYVAAKQNIVRFQQPHDQSVLNWDDPVARDFARQSRGSVAYFSMLEEVPDGSYLKGDVLMLRQGRDETVICSAKDLRVRGSHNVANVLAACAVVSRLEVGVESMASEATSFAGVEHRLEAVRYHRGVWYYNDSIATSPERAVAALNSFSEPIVLLAGGRDKKLPWDRWAELARRKVVQVIVFGEAGPLIAGVLRRLETDSPPVHFARSLAHAVALAQEVAAPGNVVLLSPGGTSFDGFRDYEHRGQVFKQLVHALPSVGEMDQPTCEQDPQ